MLRDQAGNHLRFLSETISPERSGSSPLAMIAILRLQMPLASFVIFGCMKWMAELEIVRKGHDGRQDGRPHYAQRGRGERDSVIIDECSIKGESDRPSYSLLVGQSDRPFLSFQTFLSCLSTIRLTNVQCLQCLGVCNEIISQPTTSPFQKLVQSFNLP